MKNFVISFLFRLGYIDNVFVNDAGKISVSILGTEELSNHMGFKSEKKSIWYKVFKSKKKHKNEKGNAIPF